MEQLPSSTCNEGGSGSVRLSRKMRCPGFALLGRSFRTLSVTHRGLVSHLCCPDAAPNRRWWRRIPAQVAGQHILTILHELHACASWAAPQGGGRGARGGAWARGAGARRTAGLWGAGARVRTIPASGRGFGLPRARRTERCIVSHSVACSRPQGSHRVSPASFTPCSR